MSTHAPADARTAIFARLRAAVPAPALPMPEVAAYYEASPSPNPADRIARFSERARGWQAEVVETDRTHWLDALASVLEAKGVRTLLAGRDTAISQALEDGATALRGLVPAQLHWYDDPIETCKDFLFDEVDAGITTARGGIAETGSLILWPDRNEPRTLSLVPPLHIAVLHAAHLHETLHGAMRAQAWANDLPTNALLVTGPSKTADIQRLLVYGAHGPKQLVILLLRDGATA
jgi:L-lactate dehydrogenase complex protein LldG